MSKELEPCRYCGQPPGQKVGPPALARCITPDCEGKKLGAEVLHDWNVLNRRTTQHPSQARENGAT